MRRKSPLVAERIGQHAAAVPVELVLDRPCFLRAGLEAAGHKVHVFTSPHLVRFNERVRIAGNLVEDAELAVLLRRVREASGDIHPSFFEATTAAAFLSGQVDLLGTANIVAQDMVKKQQDLDLENKFVIRTSPAHMGVRQGEFNLLRWLDTFIFYSKMNGTLEALHQKWLGEGMQPMPSF